MGEHVKLPRCRQRPRPDLEEPVSDLYFIDSLLLAAYCKRRNLSAKFAPEYPKRKLGLKARIRRGLKILLMILKSSFIRSVRGCGGSAAAPANMDNSCPVNV